MGKFMRNKKLSKVLSLFQDEWNADSSDPAWSDRWCVSDGWVEKKKKSLSKYLIVVLAKSYLYANFPESSSFQMFRIKDSVSLYFTGNWLARLPITCIGKSEHPCLCFSLIKITSLRNKYKPLIWCCEIRHSSILI